MRVTPKLPTAPGFGDAAALDGHLGALVFPSGPSVGPTGVITRRRWNLTLFALISVGVVILAYNAYSLIAFGPLIEAIKTHPWASYIVRPAIIWTFMGLVLLGFRTVLWIRYRSFAPASTETAPTLTVIIPAYNEGSMVLKSIESVARAHYPRDRIEILAMDDGSKDDTWRHIEAAAERHPGMVTPVRFAVNRGKREVLADGFARARGEIVVTIDSDSVVEPDALLAIAGPFRDPEVGAVAGKVAVYNRHSGVIPRMLHVRYILSFDFLRAVESSFKTVYCCPGALTAYRSAVVRGFLAEWRVQTFWGVPCTYGEDRALTSFILRAGYHTVYQSSAVVHTVAPESYTKLCKMFLRWDRSYIREELRFLGVVWKRPLGLRCIALVERLITNLRYPVNYAVIFLLVVLIRDHPEIFPHLMLAMGVMAFFNTLYYLRNERSWEFLYGVLYSYFSFFSLSWIFPYAFATIRARTWGTR